jgi:hypothetical protein
VKQAKDLVILYCNIDSLQFKYIVRAGEEGEGGGLFFIKTSFTMTHSKEGGGRGEGEGLEGGRRGSGMGNLDQGDIK